MVLCHCELILSLFVSYCCVLKTEQTVVLNTTVQADQVCAEGIDLNLSKYAPCLTSRDLHVLIILRVR